LITDKFPSPKLQLNAKDPTPPVVRALNVTGEEVSGDIGPYVKLTVGTAATVMAWLELAALPFASVTVTMTLYEPDDVKVCRDGLPVVTLPSPKLQLKAYNVAPPLAEAVNATC